MPSHSLSRLNGRVIAIDLAIGGRSVRVRGTGRFDTSVPGGPALRVRVADPAGDFDVLLHEGHFSGPIAEDPESGEVRVALQAADVCLPS